MAVEEVPQLGIAIKPGEQGQQVRAVDRQDVQKDDPQVALYECYYSFLMFSHSLPSPLYLKSVHINIGYTHYFICSGKSYGK